MGGAALCGGLFTVRIGVAVKKVCIERPRARGSSIRCRRRRRWRPVRIECALAGGGETVAPLQSLLQGSACVVRRHTRARRRRWCRQSRSVALRLPGCHIVSCLGRRCALGATAAAPRSTSAAGPVLGRAARLAQCRRSSWGLTAQLEMAHNVTFHACVRSLRRGAALRDWVVIDGAVALADGSGGWRDACSCKKIIVGPFAFSRGWRGIRTRVALHAEVCISVQTREAFIYMRCAHGPCMPILITTTTCKASATPP